MTMKWDLIAVSKLNFDPADLGWNPFHGRQMTEQTKQFLFFIKDPSRSVFRVYMNLDLYIFISQQEILIV